LSLLRGWESPIAWTLVLAVLLGALSYVLLFGLSRGGDTLHAFLLTFFLTQVLSVLLIQPVLIMFGVLWALVVFPALSATLAWIPGVGGLLAPPGGRRGPESETLSGRLEHVSLVQASGAASGLPPDQALLAFSVVGSLASAMFGGLRRWQNSVTARAVAAAERGETAGDVALTAAFLEWSRQRQTQPRVQTQTREPDIETPLSLQSNSKQEGQQAVLKGINNQTVALSAPAPKSPADTNEVQLSLGEDAPGAAAAGATGPPQASTSAFEDTTAVPELAGPEPSAAQEAGQSGDASASAGNSMSSAPQDAPEPDEDDDSSSKPADETESQQGDALTDNPLADHVPEVGLEIASDAGDAGMGGANDTQIALASSKALSPHSIDYSALAAQQIARMVFSGQVPPPSSSSSMRQQMHLVATYLARKCPPALLATMAQRYTHATSDARADNLQRAVRYFLGTSGAEAALTRTLLRPIAPGSEGIPAIDEVHIIAETSGALAGETGASETSGAASVSSVTAASEDVAAHDVRTSAASKLTGGGHPGN